MNIDDFVATVRPGDALVLRGVPGSGKSTLVKKLSLKYRVAVASADSHRMVEGRYVFDPTKNGEAHSACMRVFTSRATAEAFKEESVLVADNTNIEVADCAPYYALASAYGWNTKVVTLFADPMVEADRNVHGVPAPRVKEMAERLEKVTPHLPRRWECVEIR